MDLNEISSSASEDEEEVLPLDFRTAMLKDGNKIVIQAKPLQQNPEKNDEKKSGEPLTLNEYLDMVRMEPFKEEDGAIMLEPDINIKEVFDKFDLACNQENRINNTLNAPIRSADSKKKKVP